MTQVWPFRPDWSQPITETLSWLTSVLTSTSGAEQRRVMRQTPRRQIDFPVQLYDGERSYFDVFLNKFQGSPLIVPRVADGTLSRYTFLPGDTFLPLEPFTARDYTVGQSAVVADGTFNAEAVEVTSVDPQRGIGVSPLTHSYRNPTVYPGMLGWITDTVTAQRKGSATYSTTVRFESGERQPRVPNTSLLGLTYGEFPVLTKEPNSISDLDYAYERPLYTQDNQTSIPRRRDGRGFSNMTHRYEWLFADRDERAVFIDLLYQLRGQAAPLYVPTFNNDLATGEPWTDPDGALNAVPQRSLALQFRRDGSFGIVEVTSGTAYRPEILDPYSAVYKTSFLTLKRLGVDSIELQHYHGGASTSSVLFRDAPDLRRPETYFKNGFAPSDAAASTTPESDLRHPAVVSTGALSQ